MSLVNLSVMASVAVASAISTSLAVNPKALNELFNKHPKSMGVSCVILYLNSMYALAESKNTPKTEQQEMLSWIIGGAIIGILAALFFSHRSSQVSSP
jgi:uncharacterized membrane protein